MKRFCTTCGKELEASHRFCVACGTAAAAGVAGPNPPGSRRSPILRILLIVAGVFVGLLVILMSVGLLFGGSASTGWQLRSGAGEALFAYAVPGAKTLNLKYVVVGCEFVDGAKVFHMQLYPDGVGPLLPAGADRNQLKDEAKVRLEIDGALIPASIHFAGEFAVVADQISDGRPVLTPAVGAALEKGRELTVRFDLLRDRSAGAPFDAYATVALANGGSQAIGAVRRRCGQ